METIKSGIGKPTEATRGTVIGKSIETVITTPSSEYDKRTQVGSTSYVGPSKMEDKPSALKAGNSQSKKHKSTGRGQ